MPDQLQHLITCDRPDVHTHRGVTTTYIRCRRCGAEEWRRHDERKKR
ncbi:MAG TPA: hypothetical protein VFL99_15625 [Segeticoccus sp.]|nr:hypothetical protein [Segeticoccus sp.]HET8601757.1 hypothetical protein [Segeticoccus sp.]